MNNDVMVYESLLSACLNALSMCTFVCVKTNTFDRNVFS